MIETLLNIRYWILLSLFLCCRVDDIFEHKTPRWGKKYPRPSAYNSSRSTARHPYKATPTPYILLDLLSIIINAQHVDYRCIRLRFQIRISEVIISSKQGA